MFLRLSCQHFPLPRWSRGSTHHIWCNRRLFSLKQHIPSANGLCLTQKYHYLPSGSLQIETCWLSFRSGAIAYRSLSCERSWRHCPAAHLWVRRSCVLGILYSVVPHFWGKFIITPNISSVNKSFKKYFSHSFFLDSMRFFAISCAWKNKTRIYPIE